MDDIEEWPVRIMMKVRGNLQDMLPLCSGPSEIRKLALHTLKLLQREQYGYPKDEFKKSEYWEKT